MVAQGLSIIFISHKLDEVLRVSHRIAVLRAGRLVATLPAAGVGKAQLAEAMVGRSVAPARRMGTCLLYTSNLAMGMITPPFGVNLFAACTVAKISLDRIVGSLVPFVLVIIGCLMVITYVPMVSLFLRDLVYLK